MAVSPEDTTVRVERHRAERLADLVVVGSVCCSSCCCCCCCVHAIGGVAGAAAGSAKAVKEASTWPEATRGVQLMNSVYWGGFILVAMFVVLIGLLSGNMWASLVVVAVGAPFFQVGMSVLVLPVALVQSGQARTGALTTLRYVTVGAIVGAIAGTIVFTILSALGAALVAAFK